MFKMNRSQKVDALKKILSGKPVKEALPVIRVALLPTQKVRPNLFALVTHSPSLEIEREVTRCEKPLVKRGEEKAYQESLQKHFPNYNVVVENGMSDEEFDAIYEQLEKEY